MSPYLLSIALALPLYFFLHRTSSTLPINSPGLYSQQLDHVAVNCGSSGNSIAEDTQPWTGDTGSNYITSLHGSKRKLISSKVTDQVLPNDPIPYAMARLSRWPFTYTFRVTPGQKLIRLHFYPASYQGGFKRSKAFFSVKAGPYTLLSNFSASHTVDALGLQYLVKEYCVNVEEDQQLILTFSPSQSGNSNEVYAFVNGIEIISMPAALYHTREGTPAAQIIGKSNRFTIDKSIALEKVHRLNVGGSSISSIEDTGMFRDWDEDSNYLLEKSTIKSATTTIRIKYTSIPPYTAPQTVYQTSWLLVPDKQANKNEFNFTWRLPVDLGFRYLLRLHFCELEYEIKESVRKEFSLFVNEQVVEAKGDLIKWSGGNGVVVYRDYVVLMEGDRMEGKHDLLIVLRPHKHEWMEPIDATLKGLEVFKLNNPDKNLAGVNPVLLATRALISQKPKKIVFASGGNAIATGVVILLTVLNVIVYQLCRLGENNVERNLASSTSEGMCRCFSLAELISVTNNFDDELVIGSGGFGKVYKAIIDDGATMVALKRLNLKSKQGEKEFWTEIEMLSKLRHTHLVSLLGYCDERNEMILVYEFMEHGTLADHLYKIKPNGNGIVGHLSWEQRLIICIGAARGLDYLHTGTEHGIIHRDVKTTNILLGKDWIAKISDFGLCKLGSTSHSHTHVSTDVKGSFGYFDPEYFLTCRLTKKSDVYAFGVVMLEMLCGRPAVDMQVEEEQRSLVLWAKPVIKENKLDLLLDPSLRDEILPHCLKVFVEVAYNCLDSRPKGRPTMADVVARLEGALASVNQFMVPSTEKEDDHDFSVGRAVDGQFGEIVQMDDSLPRCDAPSSSTPALYSENTQGQKQSKGNVSKVFQITIEFLAKGANINQKKRKKGFRPHTCNQESSSSTPARDCAPKTIVFSLPLSPAGQLIRCSATSTDRHHQHHHPSPMRQPTLMGHAQIHYGGSRHRSRRPHLSGSRSSPTFTEGYHMLLHDSRGKQPLLAHRSPRLRPNNEAYLKGKILPTPNLRIFSFSELKTATHNFGEDRLLGEGSSGKVYKGWLDEKNGSSLVFAAKKMDAEGFQGFKEWQTEVNLLGMFSHPNLVKLLGYCREKKELLHVYEFMPKGSLDDHLFGRGSSVQPLSWDIRLHILIGAARGMDFLHTSEKQVIYRDFKTSNILLDESYNAKMTNFGWARLGPPVSETHLTTQVVGTHGYAAPEYVATGHLNIKSDVYGYGVVLIEMLTGLRAVDKNRPSAKHSLVEWVKPYLPQKRKLVNIMDSRLEGKYPSKAAFQIAQLALKCLGPYPKTRPSMKEVVETLEAIDASNE